jgi:protein TonB
MKINRTTLPASAVLFTMLAACSHEPRLMQPTSPLYTGQTPSPRAVAGQRTSFDSVTAYKNDAAEQIMRFNTAHTFSGKLPPMLPAIVVLRITVDHTGKMTQVAVQRSRDHDASKVALASMQRTGILPRPFNLATGPERSLTFSETFLFNADYRFQLRTLAPIQTAY